MLRLAEIADDSSAVAGFRAGLRDTSWIDRLAITRAFLTSLADVSAGVPELRTHSRAVARGLGYLGLPIALTDPASSDCLLVPAVARHRERIWTAVPAARAIRSAVANARAVIVLCHPSSVLSTEGRLAYRPDPILIDVRLTTGVAT